MGPARRRGSVQLTEIEHRVPAEPVLGWRYWQLQPATGLLRSVTHRRFVWEPRSVQRAICLIGGHDAPAAGCACGIHASASLAVLREQGLCVAPGEALVAGEVVLWGRVVTDAHGLRAQLAAPARLCLVTPPGQAADPAVLAQLSAYSVPVGVLSPAEAMGEVGAAILTHQSMSR